MDNKGIQQFFKSLKYIFSFNSNKRIAVTRTFLKRLVHAHIVVDKIDESIDILIIRPFQ